MTITVTDPGHRVPVYAPARSLSGTDDLHCEARSGQAACEHPQMSALRDRSVGRIAVVGGGALGSLVAARLAAAGGDPIVVSRPSPHLAAVARNGVVVRELDGRLHTVPVRVATDPDEVAAATLLFVCVKTWATAEALAPLAPFLPPDALVVSLQNGLGNAERIGDALPAHAGRVALGVTALGAARRAPGEVRVGGSGPTIIGYPGRLPDAALRDVAAAMQAAGMPAATVGDIDRWVWRKLAVNAAINGLTALAGVPNGQVAADPRLRAAAAQIAAEVETVALAEGHDIPDAVPAALEVARATAANRSSMLQDLEAGRRTEVDAIHGAVVDRAARHGIVVPATELVWALVSARSASHHDRNRREEALP